MQHIAAVGGQGQLQQGAGKAGIRLDQREQGARRHLQARQRAAQHADGFAHEPVAGMRVQQGVGGQYLMGIALGLEDPHADVEMVGAQREDGVVELARHLQRPPAGAGGKDRVQRLRLVLTRPEYRQRGLAGMLVDVYLDRVVAVAVRILAARQRRELHAVLAGRPVALRGERKRALLHVLREARRLDHGIDQLPVVRPLPAHALGGGAEDVGVVAPHAALVGDARESAGARQHA